MNGRKRIDENLPDYPEYIEKCKRLRDKAIAEETAERAKYPEWRGRDHPAMGEIIQISRKYNALLKELQKEYSYLFTEDEASQ